MDDLSKIKEKIDIVSLISEFLQLKKMGRNFKANCPFHSENTPSFVVSPERQIWHCFGCGKGGDIFTFLMEYENMEFSESLRTLAKRAGIELKESGFKKEEYSEKEKIYKINNQALKFYNFILTKHPAGKKALSYLLDKRKINKGIIETMQLGFSPSGSNSLSDYLIKKKGYKVRDLNLAGVSFERNGKVYDFFRGRIIFPLLDHRGNVVGFSGRSLNEIDMPKYINTKETLVYHKGSMFFGLNSAKDEIKDKQEAIIVEGEFDAISLFMEGIKNVVAIKGTALTENQVNLLARFTPKVILCLDQDSAGFEATKRSLEAIEKKGLTTSIIVLKDAKDPDEAVKKNPTAFKKALKENIGIYDFLIDKIILDNNKDSADGKKIITDTLLPLMANISNEIIKEHYLKKLSKEIDVSLETLFKELDKLSRKNLEDRIIVPIKDKRTRKELLEEYLLSLIIQNENPKNRIEENKTILKDYKFEIKSFGKILESMIIYAEKTEKFDIKVFSKNLTTELMPYYDTCYLFPLPKFSDEQKNIEEVKKVSKELVMIQIKEKIKLISDEIKEKEGKKDEEALDNLKKEFTKLLSELPKN